MIKKLGIINFNVQNNWTSFLVFSLTFSHNHFCFNWKKKKKKEKEELSFNIWDQQKQLRNVWVFKDCCKIASKIQSKTISLQRKEIKQVLDNIWAPMIWAHGCHKEN